MGRIFIVKIHETYDVSFKKKIVYSYLKIGMSYHTVSGKVTWWK